MEIVFVAVILCLCFVGHSQAAWHLAWEDNFDQGDSLYDRYTFDTGCSGWGNEELQCYTENRSANAKEGKGILTITAIHEWWGDGVYPDKEFTSARLVSHEAFLYGKIEMRARLPKGKHLWPAFWMMPVHSEYGYWPRSGEIDIIEYRGQRPKEVMGTLHFGPSQDTKNETGSPDTEFPTDFSQDWHIFGIDWSPQKFMWMVDDKVYWEETLERTFWEGLYDKPGQPFDKQFNILINLAVGGEFFGGEPFDPIEADKWEKPTFEIDWIKQWEWRS